MYPRCLKSFLKGFCTVVNYKTFSGKDVTYCRFFAVKRLLKSKSDNDDHLNETLSPERKNRVVKLPFGDSRISKMMLQVKSKKMRNRSNLIYFEGKRLLSDALKAGIVPLQVYFSKTKDISDIQFPQETELYKMPYSELKIWSDLTTPPGILSICKRPGVLENYESHIPVSVICDNIREPGNLGAFLRSTAGAGAESVILSEGCVDLWESKVIRGGMGSHFRIPIHEECSWKTVQNFLKKDTLCIIATNNSSLEDKEKIIPYYKINYYAYQHIALVIGGETEGISENALNLSQNFESKLVTIPLVNGVESLNSVSALSIILFEIKRRFEEKVL